MELTGTIIAVMEPHSGVSQRTGNTWMTQEYVLEVPGMYPKKMVFSIFGEERIKQFALQQGQQNVTVQFEIDAHEYNGRWFNEVRCYNVLKAGGAFQQPAAAQPAQQAAPVAQGDVPFPPPQPPQGNDDLPF